MPKAVQYRRFGGVDVLEVADVPRPSPGPGQALVAVRTTGINPGEARIRQGEFAQRWPSTFPSGQGSDLAGTVAAVGDGVGNVAVGDEVIGFLPMVADGAAAEYAIAPAEILAPAPTSIPLPDAAALPMVGLTAWQALFDDAELHAGQRVLINGAGGGVGGYAVQLAKRAGAHVIATASARSAERVRSAGPDEVIDHTSSSVADAVTEPVDVLLNFARIAPEAFTALAALVRDRGVVVNTVPTIETPVDEARGVRAVGVFVRSDAEQLSRLVALIDAGELRVAVAERAPLPDLADVHARAEADEISGKVVVVVDENGE